MFANRFLLVAALCVAPSFSASWAAAPLVHKADAVKVEGAWIRATVKGQSATGGFMRLTASKDLTLLGISSPAAADSQLHDMVMDGDVMRMREAAPIVLHAGQTVQLQPGPGHQHVMLMGLTRQLSAGDQVKLVLQLRSTDGKKFKQEVSVPVKTESGMHH
ncbi:MAG: copper chaperone PCu(A)C [Aquabacterium sp.]|nr:copper chaperone PCu(A)C [Aquabacterium sp.]